MRYCSHGRRELHHLLRVEMVPRGRGAADAFLQKRFPKEVAEYRRRAANRRTRLVVMTDGDRYGPRARLRLLNTSCQERNEQDRETVVERVLLDLE